MTKHMLAYVRVSTEEQQRSGLGVEAQQAAIAAECTRRGWTYELFQDLGCSGKHVNPELRRGLDMLGTGQLAEVELRVRGPVGAFVAERRWHASQVTSREGDEVVVRLRVKVNEELARFVLGLGPVARVVAPLALRDMVREMAERIAG